MYILFLTTNSSFHKNSGITLIELLVTISILVIIASTSIATFLPIIQNKQLSHVAESFQNSVVLARNKAKQTGEHILLCGGITGNTCSKDWSLGWSIFQINHSGSGIKRTYSYENPYQQLTIPYNKMEIAFNGQGLLESTKTITIKICHPKEQKGYEIEIKTNSESTQFHNKDSGVFKC